MLKGLGLEGPSLGVGLGNEVCGLGLGLNILALTASPVTKKAAMYPKLHLRQIELLPHLLCSVRFS